METLIQERIIEKGTEEEGRRKKTVETYFIDQQHLVRHYIKINK